MVNVYNNLRDVYDNLINGRTKLFIKSTNEDGSIVDYIRGLAFTPEGNGTMFIVDEWLIEQLDKVQFKDGTLSVRDGEELITPAKTEKELMIEEMERQLAALKAETDEQTDTEEQTDVSLLDYTEKPTE